MEHIAKLLKSLMGRSKDDTIGPRLRRGESFDKVLRWHFDENMNVNAGPTAVDVANKAIRSVCLMRGSTRVPCICPNDDCEATYSANEFVLRMDLFPFVDFIGSMN